MIPEALPPGAAPPESALGGIEPPAVPIIRAPGDITWEAFLARRLAGHAAVIAAA
jgi:hypothetical protein